ncbi:MAG: glycoside hydrolase family 38, partial [Chloroflexi bacterium]|nr:glycoside hydrolase family 38 [Chloroflexota bacterium]
EPSDAGFVCDIFGHCSQLPQILAGFGIKGGFVWRGLNTAHARHVIWTGADGTVLPCYRFGKSGYCSFAIQVRGAFRPEAVSAERHDQILMEHINEEARLTELDPILAFDGCDHQEWDQTLYPTLLRHMENPNDEYEWVHTGLDDYLAEMLPQADRISTHVAGELREPAGPPQLADGQNLIPGVLSSRVWIKQDNTACQNLLCQWAEPFSAAAHSALGAEYPKGFLDVAWKWLISNHPHDSICGCSIDVVHADMKYRFSQCKQIADRLTTEATRKLAVSVEGDLDENALRVLVANPLTQPVAETLELTLALPLTWPTFNEWFGYEPKPAFRIYDAQGNEIAYQRIAQAMHRVKGNEITVSLPVSLPALGYTTLTVRAGEQSVPTRYPEVPALATSERSMENDKVKVTIEENGTLTLTDKRNGNVYTRLLTFEDNADIGDGWFHGNAVNDQFHVSSASPADIALVHNGPMLATFRVRTTMHLPAEFCFDRMVRSKEFVDFVIESTVSLRPGADRVEVKTTVYNNAGDHRLRVLFPSSAQADTYMSDTP